MPVAVVMDFEGGTLEQYDRVMELMGLEARGLPDGAVLHFVVQTDDGIRVTDVWETREQFEQFAAEQIGPFSQQAGIPNPPSTQYHDVHNHMTAG